MKTRIIKSYNQKLDWFTPQWSDDGVLWVEFFGFDTNSPYLHVKSFNDRASADNFLKDPSIVTGTVVWQSP